MSKVSYMNFFKYVRTYWQRVLLLLVLLWSLVHTLFWVMIAILCVILLYKGLVYGIERIRFIVVRRLLKGFFLFVFIFMVSISLKLLIADIYHIPSSSMEKTLFPNDVILVNKLAYGPKLPQNPFEVSWVNLLFYMNDRARSAMKKEWWPYKRLRGGTTIKRNDVLVYQLSHTFFVVKRCVGIAGDTLFINDGNVFTNGKKINGIKGVKNLYRIHVSDKRSFYQKLDSLGIREALYLEPNSSNVLNGTFSNLDKSSIEILQEVEHMEKIYDTLILKKGVFSQLKDKSWTPDNFGPIVVPQKGMVITFNDFNYKMYRKSLEKHEKINLTKIESDYYIDGKKSDQYTFKQNYYFVIGDNRKESIDSRYVGFIPESNIVGKVQSVLFSNYHGKFQWNRLMQPVD